MIRLTRDGTAEPVSLDQILRRERGQGNIHFTCLADHVQDWQPYPVDPYSCYMFGYTYNTYIHTYYCTFVLREPRGKILVESEEASLSFAVCTQLCVWRHVHLNYCTTAVIYRCRIVSMYVWSLLTAEYGSTG